MNGDTVYTILAESQALMARLRYLQGRGVSAEEAEVLMRVEAEVLQAALTIQRIRWATPNHDEFRSVPPESLTAPAPNCPPHPYARAETDAEALARITAATKWDGHHYFGCRNPRAALKEGDVEVLRRIPQAAALARALGVERTEGHSMPSSWWIPATPERDAFLLYWDRILSPEECQWLSDNREATFFATILLTHPTLMEGLRDAERIAAAQSGATLPKDPSPGAIRAAEACGAAEDGRMGSLPPAQPGAPSVAPRFCAACRRTPEDFEPGVPWEQDEQGRDICPLHASVGTNLIAEGRR